MFGLFLVEVDKIAGYHIWLGYSGQPHFIITEETTIGKTMTDEYQLLEVVEIEFDTENPRIKKALEKYSDKITAERIHFALRSASDDSNATSSFSRLRDSIHANGGITQPIVVAVQGDKKICIDGNTRLAIYQDFSKQGTTGSWEKIPALVMHDAQQKDIETIRVSAHLVGPRPWPSYEKASYLYYLYHTEFMRFEEMVALCGGNRPEIERQIDAYEDMNEHYRDVVDDTAFHIDRFSGFVELQKPLVKQAILDAGFELKDFGEWIRDGKVRRLKDTRKLPKVLRDEEARDIFVKGGIGSIERAIKHIDLKTETAPGVGLEGVPIHTLAKTLAGKIRDMPFSMVQALQKGDSDEDVEAVRIFEDLADCLGELLESVGK